MDLLEALADDPLAAARNLLGCELSHATSNGVVTARITEVEAYLGELDEASHAYRGRTSRNKVMFGPAGHLYVYFSHGLHFCGNVVTGKDGEASAVLLRAGRVVEGLALARERRGPRPTDAGLARGPANLMQALGIDQTHNGSTLLGGGAIRLVPGGTDGLDVESGPRVGVAKASDVPWRFWVAGDETVSSYRRSPRAAARRPAPE